MAVIIGQAVGAKTRLGKAADNARADVKKIQERLKKLRIAPSIMVNGKCDDKLLKAIAEFQGMFKGVVDSRVDPRGTTLKRLNALADPLVLEPIYLGDIRKGGYLIKYDTSTKEGIPTSKYKVFLGLSSQTHLLDVTACNNRDIMTSKNLPDLLKLITELEQWGSLIVCRLYLKRDSQVISQSKQQNLTAPVKPYKSSLEPSLGSTAGLNYTGNGTGRMLHVPAIDGKYYFHYKYKFVTKVSERGFDCTTYVGVVYGVDAYAGGVKPMSEYGTQLANYVGTTKCDMEGKKDNDIKAFFEKNNKGTYMMWSSRHVVLVEDAKVHEFSESKKGYNTDPVSDWNFHGATYWIRKVDKAYGGCEPSS